MQASSAQEGTSTLVNRVNGRYARSVEPSTSTFELECCRPDDRTLGHADVEVGASSASRRSCGRTQRATASFSRGRARVAEPELERRSAGRASSSSRRRRGPVGRGPGEPSRRAASDAVTAPSSRRRRRSCRPRRRRVAAAPRSRGSAAARRGSSGRDHAAARRDEPASVAAPQDEHAAAPGRRHAQRVRERAVERDRAITSGSADELRSRSSSADATRLVPSSGSSAARDPRARRRAGAPRTSISRTAKTTVSRATTYDADAERRAGRSRRAASAPGRQEPARASSRPPRGSRRPRPPRAQRAGWSSGPRRPLRRPARRSYRRAAAARAAPRSSHLVLELDAVLLVRAPARLGHQRDRVGRVARRRRSR